MNTAANVTSLARVAAPASAVIEPTNMAELVQLATSASKTGFFGAKSPEQALLVMMSGRDLGLSYSQALRAFHVIEGKPCLSADGMVAVVLVRRDVCEYFRTIAVGNDLATVETKRVGQDAQRYTFAMSDAQRAGVVSKQTWARYPSRMLLARARAALARDVYPDLLLGLYDPDELEPTPQAPSPSGVRAQVDAAPKVQPAAATVSESLQHVADLRAQIETCGRDGTSEQLLEIAASVAKSVTDADAKRVLRAAYSAAQDAIRKRAQREPGDDSDDEREALAAEAALAAQLE